MRINHLVIAGLLSLAIVVPSIAEETASLPPTKISPVNKVITKSVEKNQVTAVDKTSKPVNINMVDAQTITQSLKGIGKKRAEAIVAYRVQNGAFKSTDELTKVKGITKKIIEKNNGKILLN